MSKWRKLASVAKTAATKTYHGAQAIDRGMQKAAVFTYEGSQKKTRPQARRARAAPRRGRGQGQVVIQVYAGGSQGRPVARKRKRKRPRQAAGLSGSPFGGSIFS